MRLVLLFAVLLGSCSPRVYWPQGHGRRAALPAAPASIVVLKEGRDYQGWSPAAAKCQQQPAFPSHALTKK